MEEAWTSWRAALQLCVLQESELSGMFGAGEDHDETGFHLTWELAQHEAWTDMQLAELQSLWSRRCPLRASRLEELAELLPAVDGQAPDQVLAPGHHVIVLDWWGLEGLGHAAVRVAHDRQVLAPRLERRERAVTDERVAAAQLLGRPEELRRAERVRAGRAVHRLDRDEARLDVGGGGEAPDRRHHRVQVRDRNGRAQPLEEGIIQEETKTEHESDRISIPNESFCSDKFQLLQLAPYFSFDPRARFPS